MPIPAPENDPALGLPPPLVGYAHSHFLVARHTSHGHAILATGMFLGVCAMAWLLLRAGLVAAGVGGLSAPAGWAFLGVILVVVLHWRDAMPRAVPNASLRIEHDPNGTKRVWCVWPKWRLQRMAALGPIEDQAFEPEVFFAPFAIKLSNQTNLAWLAAAAMAYGALYVLLSVMQMGRVIQFHFLTFYVALAVGGIAVAAARPTTIRIVPGRLDIMRGWFFSPRRPVVRTLDLRRSRLVLDLRTGILFSLGPLVGDQAEAIVAFGSGKTKSRIAYAILRAAVSTAEPAPLPDGEAVG